MPTAEHLLDRIAAGTRDGARHWADAADICADLVGDPVGANIFVVGMAVQSGLLPVQPASITHAIELNGVAVDANLAAFSWGRWQIADPARVEGARASIGRTANTALPATLPSALTALLDELGSSPELLRATSELIAFQDEKLARRYLEELRRVRAATDSPALLELVGAGLFKLMAYKDEYEVARLMLDPDGQREVGRVATPGDAVAWRLHPPALRALGMQSKLSVGVRWRPAIRALASAKRLRGGPLDPFGRAHVRRVERALPGEYVAAVHRALERGDATAAEEIAAAADMVRGYEGVKLANVDRFRDRIARLAPA